MRTDELDEAEAALRRALALAPDDAHAHYRWAELLQRRGLSVPALASMRRAAELAPAEGWLWSDLGALLADAGKLDEAKAALKRAIGLDPAAALHHYRLGQLLQGCGEQAAALGCFRRAAELGPEQAWLWSHLGWALGEAGELEEGETALERSVEMAPDVALNQFRLAQVLERRGRLPQALAAARRAAELDGSNEQFASFAASLIKSVKRYEKAAQSGGIVPKTYCVIMGAPRTGSTVLGLAVSGAWDADWLGEIFHHEHHDPRGDASESVTGRASFFAFRQRLLQNDIGLSYPNPENQATIFSRYKQFLDDLTPKDNLIIDIKYTSWHHLNVSFLLPLEPPTLIELVREATWPVVHLVRENLFALHCSLALAKRTQVWHQERDEPCDTDRPSLVVDVEACRHEMDRLKASSDLFDDWFGGYSHLHRLSYERLFCGEAFSPEVEATFTRVFGEPPLTPLVPLLRKVTPPLRELVSNRDEVLRHFRRTKFHDMVSKALA